MSFSGRQMQPRDFAACASMLQDDFGPQDQALVPDLTGLWGALLESRCANGGVVEEHEGASQRIVGFGFSLFLTDDFLREVRESDSPHISHVLIAAWKAGRRPWLSLPEIRQSNRGEGLNLLILHTVMGLPEMTEESRAAVRDRMIDDLFANHQGYNIKYVVKEVFGSDDRDRHLQFGFRQVNDYGVSEGPGRQPYLLGISRAEALDPASEGRYIRGLFRYVEPVCRLTPADQELVQLALAGLGESAIAEALGISKESVKSRWDSIYSHIPVSLEGKLGLSEKGLGRGRVLLQWLREHPEEWRPTLYFSERRSAS